MLKPVLLCGLLTLAAALRATEGSGSEDSGHQFSDLEDLEDVQEDGLLEGSGNEDDLSFLNPVLAQPSSKRNSSTPKSKKKVNPPSAVLPDAIENQFDYDIHLSQLDKDGNNEAVVTDTEKTMAKKTEDLYEYYDDLYPEEEFKDLIKNYDNDDKDEDYNYSDSSDFNRDSVLKIEEKESVVNIEIKPRPTSDTTEEVILETSQIFIMVGSAFVSFAIVMLTFFMCRRAMAKKRAKKSNLAFAYIPDTTTRTTKESSIVKDYQKVPTSTKELMQFQSTRIDMYREGEPAAASVPLVQTP